MPTQKIPIPQEWVVSTLAWLLASLGITFAPNHFFGGWALAVACATIVARTTRDQREVWLIIMTALVLSLMAASAIEFWNIAFPLQLGMGLAGLSSKWAVNIAVKMLDRTEGRSDEAADNLLDRILPKKGDDDDS